nr:DUF2855 family protein [Actinomycetota bacterium]
SSHLVVRPGRVGRGGFTDSSAHRADLPAVYNRYAFTAHDPSFSGEQEDLQVLYRPLFFTSFMLADFLGDNDLFGADQIVVSSASSKTAYGTAFCLGLGELHPKQIALTSASNVDFTNSLGCYDEVVSYDDLETIPTGIATSYVDVAGNQSLRVRMHQHLGEHLVYDAAVGAAHMEEAIGQTPDGPGPIPQFFFAPAQIQKRRADWGPGGVEKRYAEVWREFVPKLKTWVEVKESAGPDGLSAAWLDVLSGQTDPKTGLVIAL